MEAAYSPFALAGEITPPAPAIEAPATVTLTQAELAQIIQVEVQAALAADHARQSAAAIYNKVQSAFAPKSAPAPAK